MKRIRLSGHPEGGYYLRPLPQYRRDGCWPPADLEDGPEGLSSGVLASFRLRHPEVTTPSEKIARCLCWLEREFGGREQ